MNEKKLILIHNLFYFCAVLRLQAAPIPSLSPYTIHTKTLSSEATCRHIIPRTKSYASFTMTGLVQFSGKVISAPLRDGTVISVNGIIGLKTVNCAKACLVLRLGVTSAYLTIDYLLLPRPCLHGLRIHRRVVLHRQGHGVWKISPRKAVAAQDRVVLQTQGCYGTQEPRPSVTRCNDAFRYESVVKRSWTLHCHTPGLYQRPRVV